MTEDERGEIIHDGSIAWHEEGEAAVCPYSPGTTLAHLWMSGYQAARRLAGKDPKWINTTLTIPD